MLLGTLLSTFVALVKSKLGMHHCFSGRQGGRLHAVAHIFLEACFQLTSLVYMTSKHPQALLAFICLAVPDSIASRHFVLTLRSELCWDNPFELEQTGCGNVCTR